MSLSELIAATVLFALLLLIGYATFTAFVDRTSESREQLAISQLAASSQQYQQSRGFFPASPSELTAIDPNFDYVSGISTAVGEVSLYVTPSGATLGLATMTSEDTCVATTVTEFGSDTPPARWVFSPSPGMLCSGQEATELTTLDGARPW